MRNIADIESRGEEIKIRLGEIFDLIGKGPVEGQIDTWQSLSEELAELLTEVQVLNTSLIFARELAQQLINLPCSGPH
jgi:NTP pyrophosphatase (non-canonical NTP hydrolase)